MTPERARALLAESGYSSKERRVVGADGTVRFLSPSMTEVEYDEILLIWNARKYGSFNDVLRSIAHADIAAIEQDAADVYRYAYDDLEDD